MPDAESDARSIDGHEITYEDHRFVCLICQARRLNMMEFQTRECPGPSLELVQMVLVERVRFAEHPPRINQEATVHGTVRTVESLFPDGHYRITLDCVIPPGGGA